MQAGKGLSSPCGEITAAKKRRGNQTPEILSGVQPHTALGSIQPLGLSPLARFEWVAI